MQEHELEGCSNKQPKPSHHKPLHDCEHTSHIRWHSNHLQCSPSTVSSRRIHCNDDLMTPHSKENGVVLIWLGENLLT
jgi:hypothetical protein